MKSILFSSCAACLALGIVLNDTRAIAQTTVAGGLQIFDATRGTLKTEVVATAATMEGFVAVTEDLQSRIITVGNSDSGVFVSRYNSDGTPDTQFGLSGVTTSPQGGQAWGVAVDSSSRVYLLSATDQNLVLVRFLPNGVPDNTYNHGIYFQTVPSPGNFGHLDVDGAGNAAIASDIADPGFTLTKFDSSGNLLFRGAVSLSAPGHHDNFTSVRIDSQGRVLVAGEASNGLMAVARFKAPPVGVSVMPDPSFAGSSSGTFYRDFGYGHQIATDIAIASNGHIFVVGTPEITPDYSTHFMLIELDPDGGMLNEGDFTRGSHFGPANGIFQPYNIAIAGNSLFISGNSFVGHSLREQFSIFKMSMAFAWDPNFGNGGYVEDYVSVYSDCVQRALSYDPRTKNPVVVGFVR